MVGLEPWIVPKRLFTGQRIWRWPSWTSMTDMSQGMSLLGREIVPVFVVVVIIIILKYPL